MRRGRQRAQDHVGDPGAQVVLGFDLGRPKMKQPALRDALDAAGESPTVAADVDVDGIAEGRLTAGDRDERVGELAGLAAELRVARATESGMGQSDAPPAGPRARPRRSKDRRDGVRPTDRARRSRRGCPRRKTRRRWARRHRPGSAAAARGDRNTCSGRSRTRRGRRSRARPALRSAPGATRTNGCGACVVVASAAAARRFAFE